MKKAQMDEKMRKSGINSAGNITWGTHLCQFYQAKEDLVEIVIPYFKAGMENSEFCVWIIPDFLDMKEAEEALKKHIHDIDNYLKKGQIEIIPYRDWYLEGGFDSKKILEILIEKVDQALINGYKGLRLTEEAFWEKENSDNFIDYEGKLNSFINKNQIIALCTYPLEIYNTSDILEIAANHEGFLIKKKGKWEWIDNSGQKKNLELKKAGEKLGEPGWESQAAKLRLETVLKYIPVGVIIGEAPSGKLLIGNEWVKKIFHGSFPLSASIEEYNAYTGFRLDGRKYQQEEWPLARAVRNGETVIGEIIKIELADGTQKIISVSAAPIRDKNGKIINGIVVDEDITERFRVEEALEISETNFRSIFEHSKLGIIIGNIEGQITQSNPAAERMLGYEKEELRNKFFTEFTHPEDLNIEMPLVSDVIAGKRDYYEIEKRYIRKDGKIIWVRLIGTIFLGKDGKPNGIGLIEDITEHKKPEERLKESQSSLETVFTAIPDAIIEYDINGVPVRANEAALKAYGLRPPNFSRDKAVVKLKITHMDGKPVKVEDLPTSRALKGEIIEGELYRFTNAQGKELTIITYAAPIFKGDKVNGAVALWHDITELKQAEKALKEAYEDLHVQSEELKAFNEELQTQSEELQTQNEEIEEAYEALEVSEKRYRMLFTNMTEGFALGEIICDRKGRPYDYHLLDMNPACEIHTGLKRKEILNKPFLEFFPNISFMSIDNFADVAFSGRSTHFETFNEAINGYFEGDVFSPEKGKFAVIFSDVTERKKIELALKRNEKRLNDLVNSIQDGFLELDQEWRFTYINKRAANNGNFEPEELIGHSIWEKFPYLTGSKFEEIYRKVMNTRLPENFEIKSVVLNKWYETSVYPSAAGISVLWRDITDRKQVEEALRKSESDLKKAQEIAHVGGWEWDPVSNLVTGSEELYHIFGLTPDPATFFKQYIELLVPEDRQRVLDALDEAINRNMPYNIDYQVVLHNGKRCFIHAEAVTIYEKDRPIKVIGTAQDITERKAVEMELSRQRELLQKIFDNIPVLLVIWNPHLERFTLNRYTEHVLGWTTADANNGDFMARVYPDPAYRAEVSAYMLSLESGWREWMVTAKDGNHIPIEWANVFLTDDTMIGIGVDLRERKKAESRLKEILDNLEKLVRIRTAELEEAYNSLKESEEGLAEAQKMAHLGNWTLDLNTNELYWSDEVYRIFGINPEESGMDYAKFLSYVHPEDREDIGYTFTRILNKNPCEVDYRIILANGKERILHSQCEVIFNKENIPVRIKGTVQDITERKKAEEALAKIDKARIKEIHHRIKNNLQVISSLLDLQAETFSHLEVCKAPEVIEAFKESQSRIASMALIHEELYEDKESGSLNFAAYLRKLITYLLNLYNLKSSGIKLELGFEEIYLDMDTAIPLGIIVNELVSNSLKHAFLDGEEKEIRIILKDMEKFAVQSRNLEFDTNSGNKCKEKNFRHMLTVADNGKGIPQEIDFQNAETLGLQLVNILIDQIDGCIELRRDNGTEFVIRFNNLEK